MDRTKEIIQLRQEQKLSVHRIASLVGTSHPIVREVLTRNGLMKNTEARRITKPISSDHALIGQRLSAHRITVKGQSPAEAAVYLKMTTWRLTSIERGFTDLTLVDLQKIANYCGTDLQTLFGSIKRLA